MFEQQLETKNTSARLPFKKIASELVEDELKPCFKILSMLKNSKTSWPFREPVDPITQRIPHYRDIIQEPMDLSTVETNLRTAIYSSSTQFHADINKIIRNSFIFNQGNQQFMKLTGDFEKYYFKIISEPSKIQSIPSESKESLSKVKSTNSVKKKKGQHNNLMKEPAQNQPPSKDEKRQLSSQIRKLSKQDIQGVIDIVYSNGEMKEDFDLEELPSEKVRELQAYVRVKLDQDMRKNITDANINETKKAIPTGDLNN